MTIEQQLRGTTIKRLVWSRPASQQAGHLAGLALSSGAYVTVSAGDWQDEASRTAVVAAATFSGPILDELKERFATA